MPSTVAGIEKLSVLVVGKESVGKSALISSLTGRIAHVSNFGGTTVSCEVYAYEKYRFIDTPGILRKSDTETTRSAIDQLQRSDTVLLIAQATHLDDDLSDLLPLIKGKKCVVVVTFWDKVLQARGFGPDELARISGELRIEVIPVDARRVTASQRSRILSALDHAAQLHIDSVGVKPGWKCPTPKSLFDHSGAGPTLALLLMFSPACLAVWVANIAAARLDPVVESFLNPFRALFQTLPSFPREVLVGNYGLITMGPLLFVWAVPTVILYALILGIYKASGLLGKTSVALHPLISRIGLSGRDLVRIVMGFGCNVPAVISTRACSSCSRSTVISTIAFGSACSYQFGATIAVFAAANRPYLVFPFLCYLALTTIIYARLTSSSKARSVFNILVLDGRTYLTFLP